MLPLAMKSGHEERLRKTLQQFSDAIRRTILTDVLMEIGTASVVSTTPDGAVLRYYTKLGYSDVKEHKTVSERYAELAKFGITQEKISHLRNLNQQVAEVFHVSV